MLMVTISLAVKILNSFVLTVIEEVRVGSHQRTINTCAIYYSKYKQVPSALTEWSLTRT